mgnify:CR=1 FL=1
MKKRVSLLFLFIALLFSVIPIHAQSSIERIVITDILTDIESFPQVIVNGFILQSDDTPVAGISKDLMQLTENGEVVAFEMEEIHSGSHTVIVLDMGKWIGNRLTRDNGERVKNIMLKI